MKNGFVECGPFNFARAKQSGLWQSIQTKYAEELGSASPLKKLRLKFQLHREYLRRRKEGHAPSPGTLW